MGLTLELGFGADCECIYHSCCYDGVANNNNNSIAFVCFGEESFFGGKKKTTTKGYIRVVTKFK
jgi:hypothetical protein